MAGTTEPSNELVRQQYHEWLANRPGRPFVEFESYVEALCRFITLEIEAGRMFWSYELPADQTLKAWFGIYKKNRLQTKAKSKK